MAKSRRVYYTMGQICEMFDLPASTIRFWEKRFKVLAPRKNAKGNRLFTTQDLENLKIIYHLVKEKKMTLSGAETYMMQRKVAARGETSMVEILQRIRATLVEIRQELESAHESSAKKEEGVHEVIIKSEQVDELEAEVSSDDLSAELLEMFEMDELEQEYSEEEEDPNQLSLF